MITVLGRGTWYHPNLPESLPVGSDWHIRVSSDGPYNLATCGNANIATFLASGPDGLYFLVQTPVMRRRGYVISLPLEDLMGLPSATDMRSALAMSVSSDGIRVDASGHHDKRFRLHVRFHSERQSFKVTRRSYGRWLSTIQSAAGARMASSVLDV